MKRYLTKTICCLVAAIMVLSAMCVGVSAADLAPASPLPSDHFLMYVSDIFYISGRGLVLTGTVENGTVNLGDKIVISSYDSTYSLNLDNEATVLGIDKGHKVQESATKGDEIGILIGSPFGAEEETRKGPLQRGDAIQKIDNKVIGAHSGKLTGVLKMYTKEEGGRKTPIFAGYKPSFSFTGINFHTFELTSIGDAEMVKPGDSLTVDFVPVSRSVVVFKGQKFILEEGGKKVGEFTVESAADYVLPSFAVNELTPPDGKNAFDKEAECSIDGITVSSVKYLNSDDVAVSSAAPGETVGIEVNITVSPSVAFKIDEESTVPTWNGQEAEKAYNDGKQYLRKTGSNTYSCRFSYTISEIPVIEIAIVELAPPDGKSAPDTEASTSTEGVAIDGVSYSKSDPAPGDTVTIYITVKLGAGYTLDRTGVKAIWNEVECEKAYTGNTEYFLQVGSDKYQCQFTYTIPNPTHEHVWSSEWASDAGYHWHECTAAGCTVAENSEKDAYAAHNFGEWVEYKAPTETDKGEQRKTCATCGYILHGEIPELGHVHHGVKHEAVAATCNAAGNIEYYSCTGCSQYFADEACTEQVTWEQTRVPATGEHTWGEWIVTKEATETEEGSRQRVCSVCSTVDIEVLPVVAHDPSTITLKSGDEKLIVVEGSKTVITAKPYTVDELKAAIANPTSEYTLTKADGSAFADGESVGTGAVITLNDAEKTAFTFILMGDVDGSGKVDATDARLVLRAAAKLDTLDDVKSKAADVNGDGKIDATDARIVLRVSAKLETIDAVPEAYAK